MTNRTRDISIVVAMLAAAAILVPAGSATRRDNPQVLPAPSVQYTMNCPFQIVDDFG